MGFRRAKSIQGNTNCQKNIFEDDQVPGHHPRALKKRKLWWKACLCCTKNHLTSLERRLGLSIHLTKRAN